jgi:poly(3-hydroxybutyrate) depolymerase
VLPDRVRRLPLLLVLLGALLLAAPASAATVDSEQTYRGFNLWEWVAADKCNDDRPTFQLSEPAAEGRYPVALYLHGTMGDWGPNTEGKRIAQAFAEHGFVAAAPKYDSWLTNYPSAVDAHARCIVSAAQPGSVITKVCARPKADCSKGIVVVGFSQGGAIAVRTRNFNAGVRAAWGMGVNGPDLSTSYAAPAGSRALPNDRLRITLGQADLETSGYGHTVLDKMTGSSCTTFDCLRPDGSGYAVVAHAEVADHWADHCYWQAAGCNLDPPFDPGFAPPSTRPWSLLTGIGWLKSYVAG